MSGWWGANGPWTAREWMEMYCAVDELAGLGDRLDSWIDRLLEVTRG